MPNIGAPELVIFLLWELVPIVLGGWLCSRKGQPVWLGIVLGLLLSWIGVIIVAILPRRAA